MQGVKTEGFIIAKNKIGFPACWAEGALLLVLTLLSCLVIPGKAFAVDGNDFDHPDHIIVDLIGERYHLLPNREPDTSRPKYSSVVARFRITKSGGELLDCAFPGRENMFSVQVNSYTTDDEWQFIINAPKYEPLGIGNLMSYRISKVPSPGFHSRIVERIDEDGDTIQSIINTRKAGSIAWTKVDGETGEALGGSEWLIRGADDFSMRVVDNGENDADPAVGSLRVNGLLWGRRRSTGTMWGTYTLTEVKAPRGYEIDPNAMEEVDRTFTFDENSDFDNPIAVRPIANNRKKGSVAWTKVDPKTAELLAGSEWTLKGEDGSSLTVVDNGENDADPVAGSLKVEGLTWGSYTLVETKAPAGYELGDESGRTFSISAESGADEALQLGALQNQRMVGSIAWRKVDAKTSRPLAGSAWLIKGPDGFSMTVVDNGENDADPAEGALKVVGLEWGSYSLTETKAPDGYKLDATERAFDVRLNQLDLDLGSFGNDPADKKASKVKRVKSSKAKLPATGDGVTAAAVAGMGALALGAVGVGLKRTRKAA